MSLSLTNFFHFDIHRATAMLTADYPPGNGDDDDDGDVNCKKRRFEHGT